MLASPSRSRLQVVLLGSSPMPLPPTIPRHKDLTSSGQIIGHTHVTVQDMGSSLEPSSALDPTAFVFFKGIIDNGNGRGRFSATVTGGLPSGNYRVCTMSSASNHQPVLMPVTQCGAQDDCNCSKFTVGASSSSSSSSALGGIIASAITTSADSSRPFAVNGNTFISRADALNRACLIQNNDCANAGTLTGVTVAQCSAQETTRLAG